MIWMRPPAQPAQLNEHADSAIWSYLAAEGMRDMVTVSGVHTQAGAERHAVG
jgi:hypothetical protein